MVYDNIIIATVYIREITCEARDFVDIISCHQPDTLAICVAVDAYLDAVLLADYPELTSLGRISQRLADAVESC